MTATTTMSTPLAKRVLATLATLAFAFCMALAMGAAPAYADGENPSTTGENASGTTADSNQEQPNSTDSTAGAVAPASAGESPASTAPAVSPNASDEPTASGDLEAASGYTRPVDNNSTDLFIGLVPVSTDSYDINAVPTSSNSETNAIYVDLEAEVGTGANLAVAVDYMRVFGNVYDAQAGSTRPVVLPSGSSDVLTSSFPKNGLMYTWYRNGIAPLGQGTYYTDPSTNPALYATGAGSIPESSVFSRYNEKFESFLLDNTAIHGNTWPDRYVSSVPFPTHEGDESPFEGFTLPLEDEVGAHQSSMYMTSPLFFETAGERIIAVQFTCVEEFRSTITGTENVGYVIYASNPVYFRITIKEKPVVTLNVSAVDATTGASIDISGTNFEVELDKDYFNGYKSLGSDEDYGDLSFSALINRRVSQTSYPYMAPGLYRLKVRHAQGLYQEYEEYFEVTEAQASSGAAITKVVRLQAVTPQKYTITFYDEDGASVLMSGRQYNAGTVASSIQAPDTPSKVSTDKYMYVFKGWRAEVVGEGELDKSAIVYAHLYPVTCDTNYIAEYREILIKNDAGQSIVYATGNLFSEDAKPAGVLAYGLTSSSLTETEKSGIIESHSGMMAAESVLGMVRVDLTQYNDDKKKTTTNVTEHEGLEGMKLKFNMQESGIAASEGDKLNVLQIHKKDESSAEEIIEHKATVTNGEVEITLNGKLSTFVFMKDNSSSSTFPGDTDPNQDVFIGILPKNTDDFTYSRYTGEDASEASGYTPCTSSSGTQFSLDANNVAHVYLESEVGKGVDLNVAIEYLRADGTEYDVSGRDSMRVAANSWDEHSTYYLMYNWYSGSAPLAPGIYTTTENQLVDDGSGRGSLAGTTISSGDQAIDALAFTPYGDNYDVIVAGRMRPMQAYAFYYNEDELDPNWQVELDDFNFPLSDKMTGHRAYDFLYFESSGKFTFTGQLTFAKEIRRQTFIEGVECTLIKYEIYFSNPVVFHVKVNEAPAAKLVITAKDDSGNGLDITRSGDFNLYLSKQYRDPAEGEHISDSLSQCGWDSTYRPATAGVYQLVAVDKKGNHEEFRGTFEITAAQISAAAAGDGTVHQEIVIKKIPDPVPCTIAFFDEDGTTELLPAQVHNKNTLASEVDKPETPTKAEDDNYLYVFKWWEVDTDGVKSYSDTVLDVMGNMTYRAVYTAIPKENETVVNRVIAAGGLLSGGKPVGVSSYGLRVSSPDVNSDAVYELAQKYAPYIGSNRIAGVFEVNLIQYDTSGETHDLTEGLGDMTLDLPVDGVADGTKMKVVQLHADNYGGVQVIEHDLVVKNGKAHVLLNGLLSTFIVTVAPDEKAVDPENNNQGGTTSNNTNEGASGGESSEAATKTGSEAGTSSSGVQAANEPAEAEAPLTEPVKAAPALAEGALPATGDPLGLAALMLAALAIVAVVVALRCGYERRRRRD